MENKAPQIEAPTTPRISRNAFLTTAVAALGVGVVSAIDAKFGVQPTTEKSPLAPREAAAQVTAQNVVAPVAEASVAEVVKSEVVSPVREVLEGRDRDVKLDELDRFFNEFFKPEAVDEFRSKDWINDGDTVVERVRSKDAETVLFRDKRTGNVRGQFINDSKARVRRNVFEINTTSEEPNLKLFLKDLKPLLAHEGLEFYKEFAVFEEDEIQKPETDGFKTLQNVVELPEDEPIDPLEDAKILRLFTSLPPDNKLYREGNNNYVKSAALAVIPGNSIEMVTIFQSPLIPSDGQMV